ncbi:MAG: ABC transporter permease, partial [Lachnospiraceae bacterium]|nr:ABC transporter permease [Lachnospiraceae bacterium]
LSCFDREGAEDYRRILEQGEIDYDTMTAENGAVFTANYFIEEYGLSIGDEIPLTVYDGNWEIPLTITLMASVDTGDNQLCVTKEVWDKLGMQFDAKTALYISVEPEQYDSVKSALQQIVDGEEFFRLYSMDEEMEIGRQFIILVKYPMYLVLVMIAVISFMNLINTMITSIAVRKKELGILQAIGLSDKQLTKMLAGEGLVYTAGTLLASVTVGNLFGYLLFGWAKDRHLMSLSAYHYPLVETILLAAVLVFGQLGITLFITGRVRKESLIDRIRSGE